MPLPSSCITLCKADRSGAGCKALAIPNLACGIQTLPCAQSQPLLGLTGRNLKCMLPVFQGKNLKGLFCASL